MPPFMRSTLLATAFLGFSSSFALADFQLNILHINDFHARIEQINKYDSTCSAEEDQKGECFGGIARIKTAIDQRRAELKDKNLLVLSAGDEFQGSLFYTRYKSAPIAEFMNGIGFDAAAIGNHEFDDGPDELAKFIAALKFPLVSANTLSGLNTPISGKYQPYIVKEFGPEKVAIIGLLATDTDETSSPGKDVLFADEISTLKDEVKEIEGKGINKIVVLSHVGYERDKQIAAAVDGIDVIVGGHSHTLLLSNDDKAAGPYPTLVKDPAGVDVPIVTAYAYSKYLGDIEVTFDDKGVVKSTAGAPKLLDKSVTPDAGFTARVTEFAKPLDELRQKVVGETSEPVEGAREVCRVRECTMGNLVADAMLDRVKDQGVTIAITNGGGLRASIDQGPVTMGEVLTVLPFQNTVATFQLKGADIKAALENGVSKIEEGAGRFPQVSGMKFSFDLSKPAGSRVTSVEVKDGQDFKPIEDDKAYMVVSNNYMRGGGDGYSVFAKKAEKAYDYGPNLEDTVAAYLGAHRPYKPYTDGRIVQAEVKAVASGTETAPVAGEPAPNSAASTPNGTPPAVPAPDTKTPAPAAPATTTEPAPAATAPAAPAPAPSTETAAPATPSPESQNKHVIEKGDTLWVLAHKYLGAGADWKKIAEANGNLKPRFLPIGKELVIPGK